MSAPVFISYNFTDDRELAHNIGVFFQPRGLCHGEPRFVGNVSAGGDDAIDREILRTLRDCAAAIFVYGDNAHNSPWINREAELAISLGIGIVALRAPGTSGNLPNALRAINPPRADWSAESLCGELNRIVSSHTRRNG